MTLFCKLAIDIVIANDNEQFEYWKFKLDSYEKELEELQDKKKYLEEKTKEKKECTKAIEKIDKILNNKDLLRQEYTKRNENLPNNEKIFSISHLTNRLEEERKALLEQIKICNNLIEPKGYIARKQIVENKLEFLRQLNINNAEIKEISVDKLEEICNIFLECFQIKIAKCKTKKEITDAIYELRYYSFLQLKYEKEDYRNQDNKKSNEKENTIEEGREEENIKEKLEETNKEIIKLKDINSLKPVFEKCINLVLEKAKNLDAIDFVTEDEEANKNILKNIFDIRMIDLDHLVIITRVDDNKLFAEYYDEKVLDTSFEIKSDRTLKLKKKTKVFI